ncbi:hypothetical protein BscR1v2_010870 [Bartonella schoenbuchensis R1]|uniref:GlsB/YeaQ/YmgE family stress response membrane protein n=1 Tax=Bartonella schoenbuchensis (strain DSM 13525 / NCTC 13165 / R1) TaxID=687861 RepID=A0A1S6XR47_BARSR|nr:hypothetical protein BscR1v2_010870 [Bartonella schoenbuchensis R1]
MEDANIGWIAAIIIGGFAGWAAQYFMNSRTGIFLNIILGIIGASLASFLLAFLVLLLLVCLVTLFQVLSAPAFLYGSVEKSGHKMFIFKGTFWCLFKSP